MPRPDGKATPRTDAEAIPRSGAAPSPAGALPAGAPAAGPAPADAAARASVGARQGLHARPAARVVETARRFQAEIRIHHGASMGSAKDLLDVLYLAAPQGAVLQIEAFGTDAAAAVDALVRLLDTLAKEDPA